MKTTIKAMFAVLVCSAALALGACGSPDETVTGYLEGQKAYDSEKVLASLREADRAQAGDAVKQAMEADKAAEARVVSYEITNSEQNSSEAVVTVNVTRSRKGKEKTREEVYYLSREDGEWRIDWGMATFLNRDYEEELANLNTETAAE